MGFEWVSAMRGRSSTELASFYCKQEPSRDKARGDRTQVGDVAEVYGMKNEMLFYMVMQFYTSALHL
ncbi:hypothetical protein M5K25_027868 [Dendrobium thyrsiflorum]|uniref:Uncharacterized protein n=1 Tax=Dendrobium thyrsiflorum TaxID=117978 RepID=A0ABD0TV25_DENTH